MSENTIDDLVETRLRIIKQVENGDLRVKKACELLDLSRPGLWKIRKRVKEYGYTKKALIGRKRGPKLYNRAWNRVPEEVEDRVVELRQQYGVGPDRLGWLLEETPIVSQPTPKPTPTPEPTLAPTEAGDWKTYRNEEFGHEVQYPQDMVVYDDPHNAESETMPHVVYISNKVQPLPPGKKYERGEVFIFPIVFRSNSKKQTVEEYVRANPPIPGEEDAQLIPENYGRLSGISFFVSRLGEINKVFYTGKDNYIVEFTGLGRGEGKQILSTFKFLD